MSLVLCISFIQFPSQAAARREAPPTESRDRREVTAPPRAAAAARGHPTPRPGSYSGANLAPRTIRARPRPVDTHATNGAPHGTDGPPGTTSGLLRLWSSIRPESSTRDPARGNTQSITSLHICDPARPQGSRPIPVTISAPSTANLPSHGGARSICSARGARGWMRKLPSSTLTLTSENLSHCRVR
jgi:hypothetical protein